MQACNHTWVRSVGNMERCSCGKWRAMSEGNARAIKKSDQKPQQLVSEEKSCAILSGAEIARREWRSLVRRVKEMERQHGFRFHPEN